MNFARLQQDMGESYVLSNPFFAFPTGYTIESTFLDMYMRRKDFYFSNMVRSVSSVSVNHSFKISKSIGGFRLQDSIFINENMKLFIVLKEEGLVVNWKLTKTTAQKEIEPVLQSVKIMSGASWKYTFTDTCCGCREIYEDIFPDALIKLDLFHACQRISKLLTDKNSNLAERFSQNFGLALRENNDVSEIRNFETPSREKILTNLEHFLQSQCEYVKSMPRKESLYHELENLKVHIERGCLSGLPPDGGTENSERLHRHLDRSFLWGASVISPELAGAILAVIFYAYNAW